MARPSAFTAGLQLKTSLLAIRILLAQVGLIKTIRLSLDLALQQITGAPFNHLPPPTTLRETLSRKQIAPAILLYRALRKHYSQNKALMICREVVVKGTLLFLEKAVGPIEQNAVEQMDDEERKSWIHNIASQFFNASIEWNHFSETRIAFTVKRCRFPELCREVGVPELAPVFCEGDEHFFNQPEHFVQLTRPHTIAGGAQDCPFSLSSKIKSP